jgi:hypothetical protein
VQAFGLPPTERYCDAIGKPGGSFHCSPLSNRKEHMAKKTIFVSDLSGKEIPEGKAAQISIKFADARKGTYVLDVTDAEAEELGQKGRKQARRGRRPKAG